MLKHDKTEKKRKVGTNANTLNRQHAETLGGMSSSCRSHELRSSLSRGGARRDSGGGGGVSDVGSEFCRGMGGREGEGDAEVEDTPWGSYRDWEPDRP